MMPRRPNIIQENTMITMDSQNNDITMANDNISTKIGDITNTVVNKSDDMETQEINANNRNSMKSSRRKQSKPIRVSLLDDPEADAAVSANQAQAKPTNGDADTAVSSDKSENEEQDMDTDMNSCTQCPETFPTKDLLNTHIESVHMKENITNEPEPQEQFPTKYHQLGNEFYQSIKPESHRADDQDSQTLSNPPSPPFQSQSQTMEGMLEGLPVNSNGSDSSGKGSRIFHQDAYCELCDREFCNKYFLKTHKANKHGVYDGTSIGSTSTTPSFVSNSLPYPSFVPLPQPPAPSQLPLLKPSPEKTAPNKNLTVASLTTMTPTSLTPDMEDYCDICQKHFCNKYYLKKHMKDVHNVNVEERKRQREQQKAQQQQQQKSTSRPTTSPAPSDPSPKNQALITPPQPQPQVTKIPSPQPDITSAHQSLDLSLPPPIQSMPNMTSMAESMGGVPNMSNVMFINPFMPPMAFIQAGIQQQQSMLPGQYALAPQIAAQAIQEAQLQAVLAQAQQAQAMAAEQHKQIQQAEEQAKQENSSGDSASIAHIKNVANSGAEGVQVTPERLRHINKEAFCELCFREFTNKYFLRVHKANKHGIYSEEKKSSYGGGNPESPAKASPSKDADKPEASSTKVSAEGSKTENSETTVCDICNKELTNLYSLKVHKINMHGVIHKDLAEETANLVKLEPLVNQAMTDPLLALQQSQQGTMFGSMMAAKIADRVMCELCNKEVCNKYFLKTHKQKVHGIDMSKEEASPTGTTMDTTLENTVTQLSQSVKDPVNVNIKEEGIKMELMPSQGSPKQHELKKMGIDVESYCKLCKKEFSNKYFFKTHQLNVHGIKVMKLDRPSNEASPSTTPTSPMTPNKSESGSEVASWKWKETPSNPSRVKCNICNKEVCNKYFLRTHKINKHGIYEDLISTSQPSSPGSVSSNIQGVVNTKVEQILNAGRTLAPKRTPNEDKLPNGGTPMETSDPPAKEADVCQQYFEEYTEACNLCERRFKSTKWLLTHKLRDHSGLSAAIHSKSDVNCNSSKVEKCSECQKDCPNMLALQIHLIQEHQAEVKLNSPTKSSYHLLKRKYSRSLKQKLINCSQCDYKTKWLSNIYSHEQRKHNIGKIPPGFNREHVCHHCFKSFRYGHSLQRHMARQHDQIDVAIAKSNAIVNKTLGKMSKKKFRCVHCSERFPSRQQCKLHIRESHPNAKSVKITKHGKDITAKPTSFNCNKCDFSSNRYKKLRAHIVAKHKGEAVVMSGENGNPVSYAKVTGNQGNQDSFIMQPFTVKPDGTDGAARFVTSLVYLPVMEKITESQNVTFTLNPTE
ncbi:unnamed protein product [Owenia fusiformis]|uniref:Uncharacterized protein n=1 Tax=Owenia fusiformis TaxID=6347 RepID=A0A8J1U7Z4_OWEFU|nr:unnamed protein product [Owenia fusiformis]